MLKYKKNYLIYFVCGLFKTSVAQTYLFTGRSTTLSKGNAPDLTGVQFESLPGNLMEAFRDFLQSLEANSRAVRR
jgi:hypothetical protein